MTMLTPGRPIASRAPALVVDNVLSPGRWRFQLIVVDDDGNESDPAELVIDVDASPPIRRDPPIDRTPPIGRVPPTRPGDRVVIPVGRGTRPK